MFDSYFFILENYQKNVQTNYFEIFIDSIFDYSLLNYFFNPPPHSSRGGNKVKLSPEQKNDVQMFSVIVARGGLNYINKNNSETNIVLEKELQILNQINSKEKVQGTIDRDIRKVFSEYATDYDSSRTLTSFNKIKDYINDTKYKNKLIKVINNAVNKDSLKKLEINDKFICPTSSVVDAMGTTGNCYGDIENKEYYDMDFKITDGYNYYQGNTKLNDSINPTSVTVSFSAKYNDFELPPVVIVIDITTTTVFTLSANNTFKKIIKTIIGIWENLPITDSKWKSLETPKLFIELISNGAIKSVGDLFQEINSVVEMGGYSKYIPGFDEQLRIGAMGDQPSGVRAGYLLLTAKSGIHPNSIAGYIPPITSEVNTIVIISPPIQNLPNPSSTNSISYTFPPKPPPSSNEVSNPNSNPNKKQRIEKGGKRKTKKRKTRKHRKYNTRKHRK
jgi:hypothetical protein